MARTASAPGFGTTTSNIRKCSLVQSFHGFGGTFQRKTCPSRKIHADGMTNPSANWIPCSPMLLTWTGGAGPPPRMFSSPAGYLSAARVWNCRTAEHLSALVNKIDILNGQSSTGVDRPPTSPHPWRDSNKTPLSTYFRNTRPAICRPPFQLINLQKRIAVSRLET